MPLDGIPKRLADILTAGRIVLDIVVRHPVALIPALHFALTAPVIMPRKEGFITLALPFQCFKFRSYINRAVGIIADIQGNHPDRVAGNQETVPLTIVQCEGK